jgi:filamentous hemagglutinin
MNHIWAIAPEQITFDAPPSPRGKEDFKQLLKEKNTRLSNLNGSGGRWGGSATRNLNDTIATYYENQNYTVPNGAGRGSEEWIQGPNGGTLGGTWVDITLKAPDGSITRIQTVSTLADGVTPTPSELNAATQIQANFPNDTLILIAKPK